MSRILRLVISTVPYLGLVSSGALGLMVAGCGGDSDSPTALGEPVASVTISPASDWLLLGETRGFTASAKTADGQSISGKSFTWTSSDISVATVDQAGRVTAVGIGSATITAATEGKSGTAEVTVIAALAPFAMVSAGEWHTCGLTTSGEAYCWGANVYGQLGTGDTDDRMIPAAVSSGISFAQVTTKLWHTCGLTTSGAAYCWGWNEEGELGDGTTTMSTTPVPVSGDLVFASLSPGAFHTCGLTPSGEAYCWGMNENGQLGIGSGPPSPTPVAVSGGLTFTSMSTGGWHTCGLTSAGAAYCWGANGSGRLGNGSDTPSGTPVAVSGDLVFASLSAGFDHTCGVTTSVEAYCWGGNGNGKLGNGTTVARVIPVAVSGGITFASLTAGGWHTCGLTPSGEAYCWGANTWGALGDGNSDNSGANRADRPTPVPVVGGLTFASLSLGVVHTCGVTTSNDAYCWGHQSAEHPRLGDGTTSDRKKPVLVVGQH